MVSTPNQGQNNGTTHTVTGRLRPRDVVGYMALPRILPRFAQLFFSGFTFFAFFMAQVYRAARLLPAAHPYLNAANIGQFGVRDVIAAAGSHLIFRKENIDQIIIFFAILIGLVLLVAQAGIFIVMLASPEASAETLAQMFGTPQYGVSHGTIGAVGTSQDLAFIMMDRVFGVQGIFNSCISQEGVPCLGIEPTSMGFDDTNNVYKPTKFPWPYHHGLHAMFRFYSVALLMVGALIIIYYAVVIVVETAQTGTPFGKRFNTVWAPIRLVIAIGLLIPLGTGLNAAQYITLYVAKFGSNFASNGWLKFQSEMQGTATNMANGQGLVAEPTAADVMPLVKFMVTAHACKAFEEVLPVADWSPRNTASTTAFTPTPVPATATPAEKAQIDLGNWEAQMRHDGYSVMQSTDSDGNKTYVAVDNATQDIKGSKKYTNAGVLSDAGITGKFGSGVTANTASFNSSQASISKCNNENGAIRGSYNEMEQYRNIDAYIVHSSHDFAKSYKPLIGTSYDDAQKFSEHGDIKIVFGDQSCKHVMNTGFIAPLCGEVVLPAVATDSAAAKYVQGQYLKLIQYMWGGYGATQTAPAATFTNIGTKGKTDRFKNICETSGEARKPNEKSFSEMLAIGGAGKDKYIRKRGLMVAYNAFCNKPVLTGTDQEKAQQQAAYDANLKTISDAELGSIQQAYSIGAGDPPGATKAAEVELLGNYSGLTDKNLILTNIIRTGAQKLIDEIKGTSVDGKPGSAKYNISPEAMTRGWAAAGIWYNKIAQMNGSLIGAAWNIPQPTAMSRLVQLQAGIQAMNGNSMNNFMSQLGGDNPMALSVPEDGIAIRALTAEMGKIANAQEVLNASSGNIFGDIINNLFGLNGLFNMNSPMNKGAHPLAQLVGVGKGLIEASIRNMGAGVMFGGMGILSSAGSGFASGTGFDKALDGVTGIASSVSGLMFSVATITLTAGFILYYVVPFLPFLYFFFAVGSWLKGVFEAMVGVPLWALAHLRIDGNGLPGEAAINGYFMLFEIFLRPILIVFGLLASVTIFAAMGAVLGDVYSTVVTNLTGANPGQQSSTSSIDKLFYTIMYAVIMYMMALSSFKLIDLIPNQIMRWMGTSVSTFSDMAGDPAQTLTQYTAIAGSQIVNQVTQGTERFIGGMQGAAKSGGAAAKSLVK